ncbi:MAG: glycoside hydrolase family 3 N-terminal domain-containing protein [Acidobacteriota bacterium]|jgi:beta-glucosidase
MNSRRAIQSPGPALAAALCLCLGVSCSGTKWTETTSGTLRTVTQEGGPTLGYSTTSGVALVVDDGFAFKDLSKNGALDPYEDWRLSAEDRARDLASKMSIEQIAGLMLYSAHQAIPARRGRRASTYDGKPFEESGADPSDLSDTQKDFLTNDNLRHVLITTVESPAVAARWNNNAQALVEGLGLGIPANNSSDPRHRTRASAEYDAGSGGDISMWPAALGLAATFDPALVEEFGRIASIEYRALGITTALSPQIDLATEPRWSRVRGTFGEDPQLAADMARAYVDGFQTSTGDREISGGWGYDSVNAMAKHWPSGGPEEGGRDAHYAYGKYAVYPGNNLTDQLRPFTDGAFRLSGGTGMASAVMPYYTVSYGQDPGGDNVGNGYSNYIINDLLRGTYGFDGVVCTDWGITNDETAVDAFSGRPYGVEDLSVAERHYEVIMAGVDQFGGNNDAGPVVEAYEMGVEEHGEEAMRARFEQSAVRLLKNIVRTGLFENPYLDVETTTTTVGRPEFMTAGYQAQLRSVVMLKNAGDVLPLAPDVTVYVPRRYTPETTTFFGGVTPESLDYPLSMDVAEKHLTVTDEPQKADVALVVVESPDGGSGYDRADVEAGGNGYLPISLQYGRYTADHARATSLAGGDPFEDFWNRTYKGKTVTAVNTTDLDLIRDTRKAMGDKPVVVAVEMSKPMVFSEFEDDVNAVLVIFGVQDQALLEILTGAAEPSGLLPMQMPAHMKTVEEQYEDVPRDMECHVDSEGHAYDFGFGLNWSGVIDDARTKKYGGP